MTECTMPPAGWSCTRESGHEGPCAALPRPPAADAGEVLLPCDVMIPHTVIHHGSKLSTLMEALRARGMVQAPSPTRKPPQWADDSDPIGDLAIKLAARASAIEEEEGRGEWTWREIAQCAVDALGPSPTFEDGAWEPIETAPHACCVIATRFDRDAGEWDYAVVLSPPSKPFTHWRPLPTPPAAAIRKLGS